MIFYIVQGIDKNDNVRIKYAGYLVKDGKVDAQFDSNYDKDKTFQFQVGAGKVVKGMDDGVLGMKKKGRRIIVVPPQFGYGDREIPNLIPKQSTLIFQVILIFP